ncbi:MAG: hypothetical protein ACKO83_10035 [Roseiflexaceae bacterium]
MCFSTLRTQRYAHTVALKSDGTIVCWGSKAIWPMHRTSAIIIPNPHGQDAVRPARHVYHPVPLHQGRQMMNLR